MGLNYEIVDVFTDRAYAGNPLAVVLDADGLTTDQMSAIAGEFNLSETAFVLTPTSSDATYRARIFTPARELPFAGHPTVGTAVTLARLGRIPSGEIVQECGAGLLSITVGGNQATITGGSPAVGDTLEPGPLLEVAGLSADDYAGPAAMNASAGIEHTFLPVSDDAVTRASLDLSAARKHNIEKVYVFSWDAERSHVHGRLFAPGVGVMEDPATGSAAVALGVYLVDVGLVPGSGETAFTIAQGLEMGRPSAMAVTVTATDGRAIKAQVAGQVVPVASGTISVP